MSDPDRRARASASEEPLTIDRRRPQRSRGPAPVALILSLLLLVGIGGGVLYMYRGGVRQPGGEPRALGAPLGSLRAAAPPQAQEADPAAGLSIYKDTGGSAAPAAPAFVAPPEQPTPRPTPIQAQAPSPPPTEPAAPVPSKLADEAEAKPAPKPKQPAKPDAIDRLIAKAEPPRDVAKTEHSAKAETSAEGEDAARTGPAVVQIGAFSSQRLADKGWSAAAAVAPGSMAGKGKKVVPMTKDGATLYRAAITGFASRQEAQALCDRLRAAGGACFVR